MNKLKKITLTILILICLNGCVETAALVGPGLTVASTGNVYQAGLTYGTGQVIKNETGLTTVEHMSNIIEPPEKKKEKQIRKEMLTLLENRIKSTREKLYPKKN